MDVRAWRDRMGWTQREAAEQLGVSLSMYRLYEYGEYAPPRPVELAMAALQQLPALRL